LLPPNASSFFSFYEHQCNPHQLQHILHSRATENEYSAALNNAEIRGDTVTASRLRSNTAPCAADWLRALPNSRDTTLTDAWYVYAFRHHFGITELGLPDACPECNDVEGNKYAKDPFHPLSCNKHKRRGGTFKHDGVLQVLINNMKPLSNYVCKEPSNMSSTDDIRPDLHAITPRDHIISDVTILNPLAPTYQAAAARSTLATTRKGEALKHGKYDKLAAAHYAEFIPFSAETTGGLGAGARKIIDIIVRASKDRRSLIPATQVRRQVRWAK
jgi:hypothetical protein